MYLYCYLFSTYKFIKKTLTKPYIMFVLSEAVVLHFQFNLPISLFCLLTLMGVERLFRGWRAGSWFGDWREVATHFPSSNPLERPGALDS